ncbi:adenosylhomocysteinase [Nematocida homosporus]|uniref:adenosylhomocysteinase n=1 Tax=Nematocida homosporus TaxID=1912981 RepID=UPI002220B6BA|nr:adenosylhomocysteinase [Nematocida homosporus]KAI5187311.1 adenosylhomocysteinase [Nematocida homosporus]
MTTQTQQFPQYRVKDIKLAEIGEEAILFAKNEMPGMKQLLQRYGDSKPLQGARISGCLHMTVQTAVLVELLVSLGADVAWCSSNVLSTEDKAAAALAKRGISVYAWKGETVAEYQWCLEAVLSKWPEGPNLIVDDGGDLTTMLHSTHTHLLPGIIGQTEQTTTGTHILQKMMAEERLQIPAICINESVMKSKFDNIYGCRESLIDGIKRATDAMIAGKRVHICGYGDVGKGCAQAMSRMGAIVTISEADPICAMQAVMEGYQIRTVTEVAPTTDIWVTATGNKDVISTADIMRMKDLAILSNIGHFNVEFDTNWIYAQATKVIPMGNNAQRIILPNGRSIVLLAEGRLVNLGCATGHSSLVMSTSFCCQALAVLRLFTKFTIDSTRARGQVLFLSKTEDEEIARIHLEGLGHTLTQLTSDQAAYLGISATGPFKPEAYRY